MRKTYAVEELIVRITEWNGKRGGNSKAMSAWAVTQQLVNGAVWSPPSLSKNACGIQHIGIGQ